MSDLNGTDPNGDFPDDIGVLAGEYVLGALQPAEMREVLRRSVREPALGDAIAWWENRLNPLARLVAPVAVPPGLWDRIAASTGANVVRPRVWSSPRLWQATTAAAVALAAAVAGFAVLHPVTAPSAPRFVAALAPLDAPGASFVAETEQNGAIRVRALQQVAVASGRDLQLWALPDGAAAPISLGVLPAQGRLVAADQLPRPGTKLLVSLEPAGGSPTGQPTGPVLFGGTLTLLN
jgi:anti-sigma-K factor RskA